MNGDSRKISPSNWEPGRALRFVRADPANARGSRVAIHGSAPFIARIIGKDEPKKAELGTIGHAYLRALEKVLAHDSSTDELGLPEGWLHALEHKTPSEDDSSDRKDDQPPLRWLDIWPPYPNPASIDKPAPRLASWYLKRNDARDCGPADGIGAPARIVMVAAERLQLDKKPTTVGLDFGLRIPMTIRPDSEGWTILIRSFTADLPHPPYRSVTEVAALAGSLKAAGLPDQLIQGNFQIKLDDAKAAAEEHEDYVASLLQLQQGLSYDDIRFRWSDDTPPQFEALEFRGKALGSQRRGDQEMAYSFSANFELLLDGQAVVFNPTTGSRRALTTHATVGVADIFKDDPPSWRDPSRGHEVPEDYDWPERQVTRTEEILARFREPEVFSRSSDFALETDDFVVRNCAPFVADDPAGNGVKHVELPADRDLDVRHNDFSALSSFAYCRDFFDMLDNFGIDLETFVVAATREMDVYYRSGIVPGRGKDGRTINARVTIVDSGKGFLRPPPPKIEMHLALGNLSRRGRPLDRDKNPAYAQPLGIATSKRWIWHELGHYLIAARLGHLEFEFAHSVGDALAAVMADPQSRLADKRKLRSREAGDDVERFRGYTFPWVFTTRRHDRCVRDGWAWGGSLNRSLIESPTRGPDTIKGYISEQILSSTLFRLYRVLGGDSIWADGRPNFALRRRASLVTLYLIVEAIRSLAQPPSIAEMFEAAMEAADMDLICKLPLNKPQDPEDFWTGGCAHKAVRWAFEAQGMFAPDPDLAHDAPGEPLPVDIYIPDRRPQSEVTGDGRVPHAPGGYTPVSLDWDGACLWHARIDDDMGAPVPLTVCNRGRNTATDVRLRGWVGVVTGDRRDPDWDISKHIRWLPSVPFTGDGREIASGGETTFNFAPDPRAMPESGENDLVFLVEATCPADRANSDPAAMLPSAFDDTPPEVPRHLADLVANDNNLALWMRPAPGAASADAKAGHES